MTDMVLRCYVANQKEDNHRDRTDIYSRSLVLVLDTETTIDEYQNLRFGTCGVWSKGTLEEFYLFYDESLKTSEIAIIREYAEKHGYTVITKTVFVEEVFLPLVYTAGAKCVGFNLPFDLSRLAIGFVESRDTSKRPDNGISLKLSSNRWHQGIKIKSRDSKKAFINLTAPYRKPSERKKDRKAYRGCFIDLRTLLFALTNKSYSLKKALEDFECKPKIEVETHGVITEEYLDYNVNDTLTTYELYNKALERYSIFCITKEPNRLYSPASIGKAILDKIGIKPFDEKNPGFPPEITGYLMTAYYGGRVEVRIRKTPVKVTYLDFTSMYPSLYVLLGLDRILKAEKVTYVDTTSKTQEFLNRVTLGDLRDKKTWPEFNCICRLKPDNDILPVRSHYGNKHDYTIGVNYLKSGVSLWYALPDLIASKLRTGKTPIIEEAITFIPQGLLSGLNEIEVLQGIRLTPEEDIFKKLIEERIRIKKLKTTASESDKKIMDLMQVILKIIANSASYGIYVEINTDEKEQANMDVYGLTHFKSNAVKKETPGKAFNPIMATMITSGAKLILAMAETLVLENNGYMAYCDTDSIFVSPEHEQIVKDFFKPLNPYNIEQDMFKVEDDEQGLPLRDVWFYGISAKRYCLYNLDKEIELRKFSSHGLGENLMGLDQEEFWLDILKIHYNPELKNQVLDKYKYRYAVYNFRVSSYNVYKRFNTLNNKKPLSRQIKPFNFITIGRGYIVNPVTKEPIIPMLPFINEKDKRFKEIPYKPFIDYKTGEQYPKEDSMDTQYYWKSLSELLEDYMDHPESKSEGDIGLLQRKHIVIDESSIHYIGKESNELEESQIIGVDGESYTKYENIEAINNKFNERILNMSGAEALELGINPLSLSRAKTKIRTAGNIGRSRIKKLILKEGKKDKNL